MQNQGLLGFLSVTSVYSLAYLVYASLNIFSSSFLPNLHQNLV